MVLIAVMIMAVACCRSQGISEAEWKFLPDDRPEYADSALNHYWWHDISPLTVWERQGFAEYDGFAWYRVRIVVPSSMKKGALRYDALLLHLGKIDDADQTFFNGHLIGETGQMPPDFIGAWDQQRVYRIPADYINWGGNNTIAIRVYDAGADGGLYGGPAELTLMGGSELLELSTGFVEEDMILKGSPDVEIPVMLKSGFHMRYRGALTLKIITDFGDEFWQGYRDVTVKKMNTTHTAFIVKDLNPGFYKASLALRSKMGDKDYSFNFGYEPEKIVSPADPQPDFNEFWQHTREELAAVDPQFNMIRVDSLCTEKHNLYLVEMRSLGGVLIRGWYRVPVAPGRYPAIMQVPGYSGTMMPSHIDYGDEIIGFGLDIRGHGKSRDDIDPGFPGYMLTGLDDPEEYIYRGAYMDCIRGIDFLCSRPEVDQSRIGVEGASQGGALTFATAALDNERIVVCAPQVPFLSDFRDYFRVAAWPANEFTKLVEVRGEVSWDQIWHTLSYFDIKNLAPMIRAPLIMGVGLMDEVCPPHINFAAYNLVTSEKRYIVYPHAGHSLPEEFYHSKMEWIRDRFAAVR